MIAAHFTYNIFYITQERLALFKLMKTFMRFFNFRKIVQSDARKLKLDQNIYNLISEFCKYSLKTFWRQYNQFWFLIGPNAQIVRIDFELRRLFNMMRWVSLCCFKGVPTKESPLQSSMVAKSKCGGWGVLVAKNRCGC